VSHFADDRKSLLRRAPKERGAALVEFALVSLLFIVFIYAIAVFGILLST
jgi:Flp pilus assembly protein TadG